MALKGMASFDVYDTANLTDEFTLDGGTIVAAAGRCSSAALRGAGANGSGATVGVTTSSEYGYVGMAFSPSGFHSNVWMGIIGVTTTPFAMAFIRVVSTGAVEAWKGVNTSIGTKIATTATGLVTSGHYTHIGVEWRMHSSAGYMKIYINGFLAADSGLVNTDTGFSSGQWDGLYWAIDGDLDDVYWGDGDSSDASNPYVSFLGDLRCEGQNCSTDATAGASQFQEFTLSTGTDTGALLDENPPNDDTDYVESGTVGQRVSVIFPSITPTTGTIYGVKYMPNLLKTSYSPRTIVVGAYGSSTEAYSSTSQALAQTTYRYYNELFAYSPITNAQWSIAGVNGAQAIVKVAS